MSSFNVVCLGCQDMVPKPESDCSHYIVNDKILIDCGTSPVMNMLRLGKNGKTLTHILFTHLHPDHCVGLPSLIYYMVSVLNVDMTKVKICGPEGIIEDVVNRAYDVCDYDERRPRPEIVALKGGETFTVPDDDGDILVKTIASHHAVKGVCFTFEKLGKKLGFSGDTCYFDALPEFFKGCDALVHEVAFPAENDGKFKFVCGHSDPADVAKVAALSSVKRVYLTHALDDHEGRTAAFRELCNTPVSFLTYGEKIEL